MDTARIIDGVGLPGLFAAGLLDGESAGIFGGILAHRGFFAPESAALTLAAAAAVLDQALFAAGRLSGRIAPVARFLSRPRTAAFGARIDAHPVLWVVALRFAWGLHGAGTLAVGSRPIPWLRFSALNLACGLVWAHLWIWAGYLAGRAVEGLLGHLPLHRLLLVALALAAALAPWAAWRGFRRR